MKDFTTIAAHVYECVRQRGYLDGYTNEQLLARNGVKLLEEICEALSHLHIDPDERIQPFVHTIGRIARTRFNDKKHWQGCGPTDIELLKSEFADCMVVLCVAQSLISRIEGSECNLAELALDKARNDILRGVRA